MPGIDLLLLPPTTPRPSFITYFDSQGFQIKAKNFEPPKVKYMYVCMYE